MNIYRLIEQYPRFKYLNISIRRLRGMIVSILKWFETDLSKALKDTDKESGKYWQKEPRKHYTLDDFNQTEYCLTMEEVVAHKAKVAFDKAAKNTATNPIEIDGPEEIELNQETRREPEDGPIDDDPEGSIVASDKEYQD